MRAFFSSLRNNRIIEAGIGILIGFVFVFFPSWTLNTIGFLIGLLIAVYGVKHMWSIGSSFALEVGQIGILVPTEAFGAT